GVTSGGSGDCTVGGETFFQPVNEILAENNLTLVTTGAAEEGGATEEPTAAPSESAEAPPAAGDEAAACPELPVQRSGALTKAGNAQAQPDNGAFRARAGKHV